MSSPRHPLLQFGAPPDVAAWGALVVGVLAAGLILWAPGRERARRLCVAHPRLLLTALALGALGLSFAYVHHYLRGGPRIIDATAYYLQARAFLDGGPSFPMPSPSAAFRGRFLVPTPGAEALGVLFPPGYPALLAAGFALDRPLWVNPLLGAALVLATYGLALRLSGRRAVALLAATLSVVSAALRYHTADTMSHGLAALLFTVALWASVTPARVSLVSVTPWRALVAGLCVGWLVATRPVTGMVCAAACAWLLGGPGGSGAGSLRDGSLRDGKLRPWPLRGGGAALRRLVPFALGTAPGLALLGWHQLELTGQLFGSVQLRYYALADGPPGCFGLGVGPRFGCHHEHGDVVARFGEGGFGLHWALRHTLYRLHHHALDFANWEPAWLLVFWAGWRRRKERNVGVLACAAIGIVVAYGAFYFPGNYPGGGARFFLELLPLEHALVAWATCGAWAGRWLLPTALLGFACHGSFSHRDLADREGGRPMFEPELVALRDEPGGVLLFVDTDHAFNLGYDPALGRRLASGAAASIDPDDDDFAAAGSASPRLAPGELLVARTTSPDRDRLLWERLGRPAAYAYRFRWHHPAPPSTPDEPHRAAPRVELLPWSVVPREPSGDRPAPAAATSLGRVGPPTDVTAAHAASTDGAAPADTSPQGALPAPAPLRFEAEHDWPPLTVRDGWSHPTFPPAPCTSGGRALALHAFGPQSAVGAELDTRRPGLHRVILGLVLLAEEAAAPSAPDGPRPAPRLRIGDQVLPLSLPPTSSATAGGPPPHPCVRVELPPVALGPRSRWLLETDGVSLSLDYLEIQPVGPDQLVNPVQPVGPGQLVNPEQSVGSGPQGLQPH